MIGISEKLTLEFATRELQQSEYDWARIYFGTTMIGKCRGLIDGNKFTVFTINIFPEFQNNGYGTDVIATLKEKYYTIVADRVRSTARNFWKNVGFVDDGKGNFIYQRLL